jgi:hypothetical protein
VLSVSSLVKLIYLGEKMKIHSLILFLCLFNISFAQEFDGSRNPAGVWKVTGRDDSNTNWKAKLVLMPKDEENYPPKRFKGYFDWKGSNKTGGREYINDAIFDYETGVLKMMGSELEDADKNIKTTIYTSVMAEDDSTILEDGNWKSCGVIPGTWTASRTSGIPEDPKTTGKRRKDVPKIKCSGDSCTIEDLESEELFPVR